MGKIEEEVAFIVRSDNPLEVVDRITKLTKINGCPLIERPDQEIIDTYYDTPSRKIRAAKASLRVRELISEEMGKTLVTIKGGATKAQNGSQKRTEHEFEWPYEIPVTDMFSLFELEPIQQRFNHRKVRDIHRTWGKNPGVVAELVIDDLTYLFGKGRKARIFEVEIEKKIDDDFSLAPYGDSLCKKVPELEKWEHSKLSMGHMLAIGLLINVDPETNIVDDIAFDAIDYLLS